MLRNTRTFNRAGRLVEGWYWALRSSEVGRGEVKPLRLAGRELAIYRGQDGKVRAVDAHCPHMGAHLAEGKVEGNGLRCFFHHWKFEAGPEGGPLGCVDVPCREKPPRADLETWPTEEKYGLIWVWTGAAARTPVPFVPELEGLETDASLGNRFVKNCHPGVMMINAIDAHHFNSVHNLPVQLVMEPKVLHDNAIQFSNSTKMPTRRLYQRLIGRLYAGPLTYSMSYWFGSTGSVTVGPDFWHFHIIFALRPTEDGRTEGQTILVTKKRPGLLGTLVNSVALFLTSIVGNYFARGDTRVFQTIRFDFKTPLKEDLAIIRFIQHVERQPAIAAGSWTRGLPVVSLDEARLREREAALDAREAELTRREQRLEVGSGT